MSQTAQTAVSVIGIDIGKNSFHIIGQDDRGSIVLRRKWSRGQVETRLANMRSCLIGMEACVGAHPFQCVPCPAQPPLLSSAPILRIEVSPSRHCLRTNGDNHSHLTDVVTPLRT